MSILGIAFLAINLSYGQSDEILEIISTDSCECIKNLSDNLTEDEFGAKFEECFMNYISENAELLAAYAKQNRESFDVSQLDEEFGIKLGQNLVATCPAFLEKIMLSRNNTGNEYYQKLLQGNMAIQTDGCEEANHIYTDIIKDREQVPDSTLATTFNNRGYCRSLLGDYYGAISDLNEAIEMVPSFVNAYQHRADSKKALGDYTNAIKDYNSLLELDSSNVDAYNGRGLSYYYSRMSDEAYEDFNQALEIDSLQGHVYFNIGLVDKYLNKFESALNNYLKAYSLDPTITDLSYYTSEAYMELGRYEEAISILLEDSLTIQDEFNLTRVGRNYYLLEEYRNAISYLDLAISLNSDWYYPFLMRAYAKQDSTLYEESLSDFELAFELDSSYSEIPFYHGYSLFEIERYNEAIKLFEKALSINSDYAEAFDYIARSKYKQENFEGAIQDFTSSLKLYPNDPQILKERGEAYLKIEEKGKACTDFKLALELKEENNEIIELIESNCK